jgi:hypothetical protein
VRREFGYFRDETLNVPVFLVVCTRRMKAECLPHTDTESDATPPKTLNAPGVPGLANSRWAAAAS